MAFQTATWLSFGTIILLQFHVGLCGKLGLSGSALSIEDSFTNIQKLDDQECIPRLLCEMAMTAKKTPLSKEESSILAVFSNEKTMPDKNGKTPMSIYKFAIDMGTKGSEEMRCQKHFSKCPLTGKDLLSAFKSIIVSKT